jgi:hypothetical protein
LWGRWRAPTISAESRTIADLEKPPSSVFLRASVEKLVIDEIPDERRARRRTQTTKHETIIVIRKLTEHLAE